MALLFLCTVAALVLYTLLLIPFTPDVTRVHEARTAVPSVLLSSDGKPLVEYRRINRQWVSLDQIARPVIDALIVTEDHRFYSHHGIDVRRTLSSVLHSLRGDLQGGSTITQQLARNLFPEQMGRSRSITRKLKEMITALKLERTYSKEEILEFYLNTVPFLYNAYGTEMAARTYFDKSAATLDVLQSATLIGMLKGTYYYNPRIHPERSLQRRNVVLSQMVKRGALDVEEAAKLREQPLKLDFRPQREAMGPAPHFAFHVRNWLSDWADEHGYDIYADGLRVHTTLDSRLQRLANEAVARQSAYLQAVADVEWATPSARVRSTNASQYPALRKRVTPFEYFWQERADLLDQFISASPEYRKAIAAGQSPEAALAELRADAAFVKRLQADKTRLQAGFVAIEPSTGAVRAWVGSRDYATDPFDHVNAAVRQPGSTFKPFVYAAALQGGMTPERRFPDVAVAIPMPDGKVWQPGDARARSGEPISLRDGLTYSRNNITAQIMQEVGAKPVVQLAHKMGVRQSTLDPVPSLALGTSPVTLLEMVSGYATIADRGRYKAPWLVWRISDRHGNVLAEFGRDTAAALDERAAIQLIDMMRGVIDSGTGRSLRGRFGIQADVAGKTGTTQGNADGWFILMHPQLVAGAWVGFNDPRVAMRSSYWGQGANNALLLVGDFYRRAFQGRLIDTAARFPAPPQENIFRDWYNELERRIRSWGGFGESAPQPDPPSKPPAPTSRDAPQEPVPSPREIERQVRGEIERSLQKLEEIEAVVRRQLERWGGSAPERESDEAP